MTKGIFITGTDTDVGKTVVSAGILALLREAGLNAGYFKIALSGAVNIQGMLVPGDAVQVRELSGLEEPDENLVTYVFENPVSPHLASILENKPIDIDKIKSSLSELCNKYEYLVIEGSGGIACPLIDNKDHLKPYLILDFIKDIQIPGIIVSKSSLGTINHSAITHSFAINAGIPIAGFIFNEYIDSILCNDNINLVHKMTDSEILGKLPTLNMSDKKSTINTFRQSIDLNKIIKSMEVIKID